MFICGGSEFTFMYLLRLSHLAQWIDSCVMSSRCSLPVPMSAMSLFGEEGGGALPANFYGLCCALKVGRRLRGASIRGRHNFDSACKCASFKAKGVVQA